MNQTKRILIEALIVGAAVLLLMTHAHCQCTTLQIAGPQQFLPAGTAGPAAGSWGYNAYQLRQCDNSFSFMSEQGWYSKPPGSSIYAYSVNLPNGETTINSISGSLNGIAWANNTGFWVEVRTRHGAPLVAVKSQLVSTTFPAYVTVPVHVDFPDGITTDGLQFWWMNDLAVPATQSWSLVFSTGVPQPEEFCQKSTEPTQCVKPRRPIYHPGLPERR